MNLEYYKTILEPYFYGHDDEWPEAAQTLNLNDVWGWACNDCQYVGDEEIPELAKLVLDYGWCGMLYWVSRKRNGMRSEFHHYNRMIDFVANEEKIKEGKSSSEYAYTKTIYSLGE